MYINILINSVIYANYKNSFFFFFLKEILSELLSTDSLPDLDMGPKKEVQNFFNIFLKFHDDIMINLGHRKANKKKLFLFET